MLLTQHSNVGYWLDSEVQRPEIDVRYYPSLRHSGQGWEGLKVTRSGHSAAPLLCNLGSLIRRFDRRQVCDRHLNMSG